MSLRGVTHRIWSLKYSRVRFRRAAVLFGLIDYSILVPNLGFQSRFGTKIAIEYIVY